MDLARSLANLRLEQDAIVLYDALADLERDPARADAFRRIAANERRHAAIWEQRLRELGADVPPAGRPRARVRVIVGLARRFGTHAVSDLVRALEGDEDAAYGAQAPSPEIAAIAADEREHAEIWRRLDAERANGRGRRRTAPTEPADHPAGEAGRPRSPEEIQDAEAWHRSGRSGTLRAAIFGVSDGLVSNLALVMGVAGAASEGRFILLAGIAGLLAGAFSMAAGEYVSMQSQRELFQRQIDLERSELEAMPDEEQQELAAIYMRKGFPREDAERFAAHVFRDPDLALETLVREELGLDPGELGSPWGAALGSFAAFGVGAVVPVLPYLAGSGTVAFVLSFGLSLGALFAVGALVSLLTGRGALFSGFRQLAIGAAAAIVTYGVGSLIGVGVAG